MCMVWRRCQVDVGVQTDWRQASGQLAFAAFHKPFTPTTSPLYPHSVILAFALFLFVTSHCVELSRAILNDKSFYIINISAGFMCPWIRTRKKDRVPFFILEKQVKVLD